MVKIVGKDDSQVLRTTCRGCASVLEYTRSEIKERWVSDWTGDRDLIRYIDCPNCQDSVTVRGR